MMILIYSAMSYRDLIYFNVSIAHISIIVYDKYYYLKGIYCP